jgi:hypothetical protein
MPRYLVSPDGGSFITKDGPLPAPDGWEEITAEEYQTQVAAARSAAADRTAQLLANDGVVKGPSAKENAVPAVPARARRTETREGPA